MAEHGTISRYKKRCRCEPCRAAWSTYNKNRLRQQAYGRWRPFEDATAAREHLLQLRASDMGLRRVAELSGIPFQMLGRIRSGKTTSVRPATMFRIMAVQPGSVAGGTPIDGTGTRRRIQSLVAVGWSVDAVAVTAGVSNWALHRCLREELTTARTATLVRAAYDQMWDTCPPVGTKGQRIVAARSRARAEREGWVRPMAWSDDEIDNPSATPDGMSVEANKVKKLPDSDELLWLVELGETDEAIAMRFGVKVKGVRQARHRARAEAAA